MIPPRLLRRTRVPLRSTEAVEVPNSGDSISLAQRYAVRDPRTRGLLNCRCEMTVVGYNCLRPHWVLGIAVTWCHTQNA